MSQNPMKLVETEIEEAEIIPPKRTQEVLNQEYSQLCVAMGDQLYKILKQFGLFTAAVDKIQEEARALQPDKPKE